MAERIALRPESHAEAVARAAAVLRDGGVALLPAEGVYGYHALAAHRGGMDRLGRLKARDPGAEGKGWIGLVGRPDDAYRWLRSVPAPAAGLIRAHWPGALTLVLDAGPAVPTSLRAPDGTVALRCPGSAFLREVILAAGGIVVSTSANLTGVAPPAEAPGPGTGAAGPDLVVDAGRLSGTASTLVRVAGEHVRILRAGGVSLEGTAT